MRSHRLPYFVLCLICVLGLCAAAQAFDVVKDGQAQCPIVVPDNPDSFTKEAARLFQHYVKESTGAELSVVEESKQVKKGIGIRSVYIGPTKAAKAAGFATDNLVADSYFMKVQGGNLFLIGHDDPTWGSSKGLNGAKGTSRAVLDFLHDYAGVIWALPVPQGTCIPKREMISAPDDLDVKFVPGLLYNSRNIQPRFDTMLYPWPLANGARRAVRLFTEGGHTWSLAFPNVETLRQDKSLSEKEKKAKAEEIIIKFAKESPDVYALDSSGRRRNQYGDFGYSDPKRAGNLIEDYGPSLCTSHPDFVPRYTKWVQDKFDQGFDIVEFGQSDAMPPDDMCHCDRCNKMFGVLPVPVDKQRDIEAVSNRLMIPHLAVMQNCLKSHPNKYIQMTVYQATDRTLTNDRKFDYQFPPNVVGEACTISDGDTVKLHRYFPKNDFLGHWWKMTLYNYWWLAYSNKDDISPKHSPETIAAQAMKLVNNRIIGNYYCGGADNFSAEGAGYYVSLRLPDRPQVKAHDMVKEFCTGLYGNAAGTMLDFWDAYYEKMKDYAPGQGSPDLGSLYGGDASKGTLQRSKYLTCWPPEKLDKLEALLQKAEKDAAGDQRALGFIRLARIGYDQVAYVSRGFAAYVEYQKKPTPEAEKAVQAAVDAHEAWANRLLELKKTDPKFVEQFFPNYDYLVGPEGRFSDRKPSCLGKPFVEKWKVVQAKP